MISGKAIAEYGKADKRRWQYPLLFLLGAAVFLPVMWNVIPNTSDYVLHNLAALRMWQTQTIGLPHFLYQLLVLMVMQLPSISLIGASIIVSIVALAVIAPMVRSYLPEEGTLWPMIWITLCAALAYPITITAIFQKGIYTGYIPITVFHSPTLILLKPLALWNFILVMAGLTKKENSNRMYALGFGTLVLATLAKPNYTLDLLPAAVLFSFIRWWRGNPVDWKYLSFAIVLPSLLLLGWQYYFTFVIHSSYFKDIEGGGIIFDPFAAVSSDSNYIFFKFLCSILFPLAVSILFWRKLGQYPEYALSLFIFGAGCLYFYLFAEPGVYLDQKRFIWSACIGLFLLFVVCLRILVVEGGLPFSHRRLSRFVWICYGILAISAVNGLLKYIVEAGYITRTGAGLS